MGKVKEINLGRGHRHQMAVCRFARQELSRREGGIVLADGVGLGKTYEALAAVASLLSKRQHGREREKRLSFRVLIIVPPGLVSKWADELLLPDRFLKYLESWRSSANRPVVRTFKDVVILRREKDLEKRPGELRYGRIELPPGLYLVNCNLMSKPGRRVTQIHKTRWDAVIIDEAHHIAGNLLLWNPHTLLANKKTATLLLTATPFQLSPSDMRGLLEATFGGYEVASEWKKAEIAANELYDNTDFKAYRKSVNRYFRTSDPAEAKPALKLRGVVSAGLRSRIVRNKRPEDRCYFLVDSEGKKTPFLKGNPFRLGDAGLEEVLAGLGLIDLNRENAWVYLRIRERIADSSTARKRPFVAAALRQLLSTWDQFRRSAFGPQAYDLLPSSAHPKTEAVVNLVNGILKSELREAAAREWIGKVLIFTTYVGAEYGQEQPQAESAHGTASALKRALTRGLRPIFPRAARKLRAQIAKSLLDVLDRYGTGLEEEERHHLQNTLRRFAGSAAAKALLSTQRNLKREARHFRALLRSVPVRSSSRPKDELDNEELNRRMRERRQRLVTQILDRYATRDLVARFDGATHPEERDRHMHGFNSPFAPLVLIASSVGQEGIDLQTYCRHVVHYDLEWNPAKLEQREGRVDRHGRLAPGPVNVYFLLCRGTYDERMLHVMVNRFRWHQILLANRPALGRPPGALSESHAAPKMVQRLALDLRPGTT